MALGPKDQKKLYDYMPSQWIGIQMRRVNCFKAQRQQLAIGLSAATARRLSVMDRGPLVSYAAPPDAVATRHPLNLALCGVLMTVSGTVSAALTNLSGYFRTGIAGSSASGRKACFGLPDAQSKFRLGNECQTYGEFTLSQVLAQTEGGIKVTGTGTFAASTEEGHLPRFREACGTICMPVAGV